MTDNVPITTSQEQLAKFFVLLRSLTPVLFTIEMFNSKFLKDMEYGDITIIQHVSKGKINRIEAVPKYSIKVDNP